ncbi:MAG: hypothetical protein J1E99_06190 [Muribaculaceae bacterium]|nr:hypothetical protein [Muribaculaceae bacterium]
MKTFKKSIKNLMVVLLLAVGAQIAMAQNEISIFYGGFPLGHIYEPVVEQNTGGSASSSIPPVDVISGQFYNDKKTWGSVGIMYMRDISSRFSMGISYIFSTACMDTYGIDTNLNEPRITSHIAMLSGKWTWINVEKFHLYSRVGFGVRYSKAGFPHAEAFKADMFHKEPPVVLEDHATYFAWQVSALCFDYMFSRNFGFFVEAGAGTQGCVLAGLKTIF